MTAEVFADGRLCRECGKWFKPRPSSGDHTCRDCYRFTAPATHRQDALILQLAELLGVEVRAYTGPYEAGRVIDDLKVLCDLEPNIGICAADGCERYVNLARKTERARTYCGKHRKPA